MTAIPASTGYPNVAHIGCLVFERLSQSRPPGLARWASAVCDALLARFA
jgi:hypothetical protein